MTSKINRKKSRKLLYQEIYASTFCELDLNEFYNSFFDEVFTFERDENYLAEMNKIIKYYESFFVFIIKKYSPKFDFDKMSIVNIIPVYIALAEMFFLSEEIPGKVSVNEAVEVAKVYWDDSSKKIVNWILNKVLHEYDELNKISLILQGHNLNAAVLPLLVKMLEMEQCFNKDAKLFQIAQILFEDFGDGKTALSIYKKILKFFPETNLIDSIKLYVKKIEMRKEASLS